MEDYSNECWTKILLYNVCLSNPTVATLQYNNHQNRMALTQAEYTSIQEM